MSDPQSQPAWVPDDPIRELSLTELAGERSLASILADPRLALSSFERKCALLWAEGCSHLEIAEQVFDQEWEDYEWAPRKKRREFSRQCVRRVVWAVDMAARRVARLYPQMYEAAGEFQREVVSAHRNRIADARETSITYGMMPQVQYADKTAAEIRALERDPRNMRSPSLRSPIVSRADLPQVPIDALRHLQRGLNAAWEMAATP